MPTTIANIRPSDNMIDDLAKAEARIRDGEYGEIVIPLDPELVEETGYYDVVSATSELADQLIEEGIRQWPGKPVAQLNWSQREVHIYFIGQPTPASLVETPSMIGALFPIASAAARVAPTVARTGFWTGTLSKVLGTAQAGAIFIWLGSKFKGLGRFVFKPRNFIIGGALIWIMVDKDSFIKVIRHIISAGTEVAGGVAKDLFGEWGLVIAGGIVAGAGLLLFTRK